MSHPPHAYLRRSLLEGLPAPVWPPGSRLHPFEPERHSKAAHALLVQAYGNGGGSVDHFESWWTVLNGDPEYDPAVFFLAVDAQERIVRLAQCWTGAFLKDLAVADEWRRKGLGQALLLHAFNVFRLRGASHFDLKVEDNNPSGAGRLYRRLGMTEVDQGQSPIS